MYHIPVFIFKEFNMGGSGGGFSPSGSNSDCRTLQFNANVNSPQTAISQLKSGDILEIVLLHRVVTVMYNGNPIGSITGPRLQRIVSCIQNGYNYIAEVNYINGGTCNVTVKCND
ncbi:TPA: hypothetical protein RUY86_003284 [Vibrio cholerae]|uniref:hypothetical protein n=1 Tax=Vibrio cholerae TaxID=666 RepID=UPI0028DA400F|nr:hypothetical protein [Vibrio cholerae]ELL7181651.1 hypothetical protein [Vibrio cholerae]MDV2344977.1 hypothetical protein [Vibrio cholerae]HDZ9141511.1 hypothetical protein [Vibrio cholerae]